MKLNKKQFSNMFIVIWEKTGDIRKIKNINSIVLTNEAIKIGTWRPGYKSVLELVYYFDEIDRYKIDIYRQ